MHQTPLKLPETQNMAEMLAETLTIQAKTVATVIGLYGDLGAGKTTFMQFFGTALGVKEKMVSPTFVIEKIYKIAHKGFDHLIHIDAYRLESSKELLNLGWQEIVSNPKNIICIEWADKVEDLLPENHISLSFSHHDQESRIILLDNA